MSGRSRVVSARLSAGCLQFTEPTRVLSLKEFMEQLPRSIAGRKERLDQLRPLSRDVLLPLQKSWDVDLTYTSNAIEGNTLTLRETAELIEHGITVGGKPLGDHL